MNKPKQKKALWCSLPGAKASQPKPKKRIAQKSNRQRKLDALYKKESRDWLSRQQKCALCKCGGGKLQLHHRFGRLGTLLIDKRFWAALHPECHEWVHTHIEKARSFSLIALPGQFNTLPDDAETERLQMLIDEALAKGRIRKQITMNTALRYAANAHGG